MNGGAIVQTYDYIVIGAGSAGCVVARRLSDDPSVQVLLLETGGHAKGFWATAPAGMAQLFKDEKFNWRYSTEPVPTLADRSLYWPRGKALGGSSAINGMVYIRGNQRDFDHWESLGNPGWGWDSVLPLYRRIENYRGGDGGRYSYGSDGPLTISDPAVKHPTAIDFIEAAKRNQIPTVEEFTGMEPESAGFLQATIRNGARQSSYDAFIAPIRNRSNLVVKSGAHVKRVLVQNGEATGVEVLQDNQVHSIAASRQVIVSAGALNSPQVLMLSGIGDGDALRQHGIETVLHLPGVGQNLQDHFVARIQASVTPESSYNRALHGWRKYVEGIKYLVTGGGYLALAASMAAALVKSSPEVEYTDLEISFRPMTFTYHASGTVEIDNYNAMSASVYNTRPASRGEVRLRSSDPLAAPVFHPNFLSDERDIRAMVAGLRKLRTIWATEPLASRVIAELTPGAAIVTDDQIVDYMRREGQNAYHPAGSCKMGNDPMAVVDARLRVRGIGRLRVADASIMPTVTSGNTNAPSIMIGEKAAAMISEDAKAA